MKSTSQHHERIALVRFAAVYSQTCMICAQAFNGFDIRKK
jgi:hypothetical protein